MSNLKELSNLRGRRALITGATGGLGKIIASTLAEMGADLVIVDREPSEFAKLKDGLVDEWDVNVECYHCDLENQDNRKDLISNLLLDGEELSILVNNAALVGTSDLKGWNVPFEGQTLETWRRVLEVNITAIFDLSQGLLPLLNKSKGSSIINIASIYAVLGPDWSLYKGLNMANPAAYATSKAGVVQLSKWLATTLAPNVRVNSISPGGIFRNQHEEFVNRYCLKTPLGRMATEDDFRGAIAYLASDLSKYMTGQNLMIDGGWSAW